MKKNVLTIIFNEKKKKIQTEAVLTLLTDANLKNLHLFFVMTPFHCIISYFEKKFVPLNKRLFLPKFSEF